MYVGQSWFSLQEGALPAERLVPRAARQGLDALVLADRGALYGVPAFVHACRKVGVKPIVGCSLASGGESLIFVAASAEGYRSLCRLITHIRTQGPWTPAPSVWDERLAESFDAAALSGLVVLLSHPSQVRLLPEGCPAYLMLDVRAPHSRNRELSQAGLPMVAVDTSETPLSPDQLSRAFAWCPEALATARELELGCADSFPDPALRLPHAPGEIRALARMGLERRYGVDAPYDLLDRELEVIASRGLSGYFLVLWDLVRHARQEGIPVGPGRGSVVGSLTAYSLGITAVDPISHGLYFERFLNPERPDLPDIDIDVCSLGRQRLLQYLRERYGHDRVALTGVLATLGPRGALREAGRMLGTPRELVDAVAGSLPQDGSIQDAVRTLPEFQYLNPDREPIRSLLAQAQRLQGRPWHPSVHAAGVVISPEPLSELVPLEKTGGGEIVTQYTSGDLEALGLLKMDILGLRNLTVIQQTCAGAGVNPSEIPAGDSRTFALLASGQTLGVFQLDSPGIRNLLRQVRPQSMDDLIAILSLYRPGPSQAGAVEAFCRRRQGREKVRYLHPSLAPILGETFGVILYQEQVMRLAHEVAGLSLAEADQLRRALAHGDPAGFLAPFVEGALSRGIPASIARQIFGLLERCSGYSFNKAHTAAYAQLSYVTAYLKAHHPAHYFAALLTHESGYFHPDVYLREAERLGVELLPPHINSSQAFYTAESSRSIRAGLLQVKGLGLRTAEAILAARARGPFQSLDDLAARLPSRCLPSRLMERLWAEGCFAGLPGAEPPSRLQPPLQGSRRSQGQLTLFDLGLDPRQPPAATPPPRSVGADAAPPGLDHLPEGSPIRVAGVVITCQRHPMSPDSVGLNMLLQVGAEQVSVLVPPSVYARDLLAIDPAGLAVEGKVQRRRGGTRILALAIRPAV